MRADMIQPGTSGRWTVTRKEITPEDSASMKHLERKKLCKSVPPGTYTWLHCLTMETAMRLPGETVMNDFPCELSKHLEFIMRARGRVLVGGLGMGCVVRGLLAAGRVESIDVVERSEDVIKLCGASVAHPRVTIQKRSAEYAKGGPWDWAWWDLWSDPEKSERHLQIIHIDLIHRFIDRVRVRQGAWAMPRWIRRKLCKKGVML